MYTDSVMVLIHGCAPGGWRSVWSIMICVLASALAFRLYALMANVVGVYMIGQQNRL